MAGFVISLTSVPPRFDGLGPVLSSLVCQGADAVELWLPHQYRRFPEWDGQLPEVPEGVYIRRAIDDLGPATKYLLALECHPEDQVLACDDDAIYGSGWATGFLDAADAHAGNAIAASAFAVARLGLKSASRDDLIVQGFAGVLLHSEMLGLREIGERDRFVDDIWLSASLAAASTTICHAPELRDLVSPLPAPAPLQDLSFDGLARGPANVRSAFALAGELGIWGAIR